MRTLAILSSCLFFIAGTARGQSVLTGYVYNTDKDPLESVTVALLNSTDSTLVVSTLTDSLGRYELTGVFKGEILQYIYHSGYSDYYRTISATSQSFLPDIFLYRNEYDIKDIVVSTKRFEQSSDRFIYNVAGSKLTEGGDAMTIFRNTPLLNVDEYERISILGKGGVQYQINGRRLRLSGEALTNYIKAIPAEDIVRLEIITSPGSAYQSEGNYGIINIVTSKNIPPGFKGRISFTDAQNKFRNNQDGNMSFTYNRGKFLISATGYSGYNYFVMESQSTYDFKQTDLGLSSENRSKQGGLIVGGSLNLDYNIDDNKTLGIQFNKSYAQAKSDYIDQTQYFEYSSGQFDSLVQSHNIGKNPLNQTSASLNYYSKYSIGNTFTVDAGYSNTRRNGFSHTIGESYLAENGQISRNLDFIQKVPNKIDNVSTLIDYNLNLSNDDKLSIGAAFFYTHSDNDAYYANRVHDNYERDNIKSNHFLFTELISATYVSYKRKWSDDLETTLGVRGEYLYNEGKQKVDNSKFYNNKFNIFPSVGISFKNIISYNFSSRIRRPGFMLLNPFRVYTSSDSYVVGNPFLQSANTYTQELSFVLNQKFILRASHNFTRRIWDQFLIPEENQLHYTYLNYGISHEAFLVLIHNEALVKNIWDISNTLTYGYVTNKSNTEDIKFKNS